MPKTDNLYNNGLVLTYDEPDNDVAMYRYKTRYLRRSEKDQFHTVMDGERLDTIAYKYYGNSKFWWILADVNDINDSLINPFVLETGSKLLIPDIDNFESQ